jgi:hypothetical protein
MAYRKTKGRGVSPSIKSSVNTTQVVNLPNSHEFGEVIQSKEIEKCCISAIAQIINHHPAQLRFDELVDSARGVRGLYSAKPDRMSSLEGKKFTPLLSWFEQNVRNIRIVYWVGVRIGTEQANQNDGRYIRSVSLTIARTFPGAQAEGLLRAEWDYNPQEANHAQPHWHIYKSILEFDSIDEENLNQLIDPPFVSGPAQVQEFSEDLSQVAANQFSLAKINQAEIKKDFHYAMCAHWNLQKPVSRWPIKEHELEYWIKNCLLYIKEQLEYPHRAKT